VNGSASRFALITGASSGIGAALAEQYAANGYGLILSARRVGELNALAAKLQQAHGVDVDVIPADLGSVDGAEALAAAVSASKRPLAALINNAGYGLFGEFEQADLADTLRMMQLNMLAPVALTHRLLPQLKQRRGHVMNVASTAAFQPGPYMAVYYATKSFVLNWSEALAEELRGSGVSVTALCPGPTASGFQDRAAMHESALVKGKRLPTSADVARYGYVAAARGQRVAIHGAMNWLLAQSVRFTPRRMVTMMVRLLSRPT